MLVKGQSPFHFSALTVAWIKLASLCLVLSLKQHTDKRRGGEGGREGERKRERERGGRDVKTIYEKEYSESYSCVKKPGTEMCLQQLLRNG